MIKSPSQKDKVHHAINETDAYSMKVLISGLMNADFIYQNQYKKGVIH